MTSKKTLAILMAVIVVLFITSAVLLMQYLQIKADPQKAAAAEIQKLVATVGQLILLPSETPTVATVVDPAQLKDQAFFANATKGDKLLIYTNAKKAILYDPVQNKIIEVAPINIGNTPAASAPSSPSPKSTTP